VGVGEFAALLGESVEIGSLRVLGAVAGEITIADVVGHDEEDVRLFGRDGTGGESEQAGKKAEHGKEDSAEDGDWDKRGLISTSNIQSGSCRTQWRGLEDGGADSE
jgi:hypothetical protein